MTIDSAGSYRLFFLANVRSLTNKRDDFDTVVRLNHPDIICLTSEAVSIDRYDIFRKDRNRQGGLLLVMCDLDYRVLDCSLMKYPA